MTNEELLLTMNSMLDEKFETQNGLLRKEFDKKAESIKDELRMEMREMKSELRTEMREMKGELRTEMQEEIRSIRDELGSVKGELRLVRDETRRNSLILENDVLPRLQNIESCYTDTYERYQKYGDRMEEAFADISLLKLVVKEHSEKLKNIS